MIATARNAGQSAELLALQAQHNLETPRLHLLDGDVQADTVQALCQQAWALGNGIDIWFYNAGLYSAMRTTEWEFSAFTAMNQVNYLGAVKLMIELESRQRKTAKPMRWIWNISLSADFGLPYGGGYSAPKAALLNLAESLQPELAQQKIQLQVINHGFVKTRLTAKNTFNMPGLMAPEEAAERISQWMFAPSRRFELRFPFALATTLALLKRLPKSLSLWLTKRML